MMVSASTNPEHPPTATGNLRIVVFSDAFRHRNGVGAYYCDLIEHLRSEVAVAQLVCPGLTPSGKPQGLSVPLPGDKTQKLCLPGIPKALRAMRSVRPHVVILASPGPYGLLGLILSKVFRAELCFGYHTAYDQLVGMYWNKLFGRVGGWYLRWLDRRFFRASSMVVTNSHPMSHEAIRLGADRVTLVGTPVEPGLLSEPIDREDNGFGPALFVGRLAPEKNLDAVLASAQTLSDVDFVIAGDGPLRKQVEEAAAALPNLDYMGWVDRDGLIRALDRCEFLVLPSSIESFGTVAIEAMARNRWVLASAECGIRDWPELLEGMELMQEGESLPAALARMAEIPVSERRKKARRAREHVEAFNRATIRQWLQLLVEIAAEKLAETEPPNAPETP